MKIYPWKAVALGRIPTDEAFKAVEAALRVAIERSAAIQSGVFFGSWHGGISIASDLDLVIMREAGKEAEAARDLAPILADTFYVPVHPILMTVGVISNTYLLDPGFLRHLLWAEGHGGQIKAPMSPHFPTHLPKTSRDDLGEYATRKLSRVERDELIRSTFDEAELNRHRERALDAAAHIVRKLLQVYFGERYDSAGKVQLLQGIDELDSVMAQHLRHIYTLKERYLQELHAQSDERSYNMAVKSLDEAIPSFLMIARRTLEHLATFP